MRTLLWTLLTAGLCCAQGTTVKPKAADYPESVELKNCSLGAEFMVHSIEFAETTYISDSYLVVEVAVFPVKGRTVAVSSGQFSLRLNGKKEALRAQPAGMVVASLKYPDWEIRPQVEAVAGMGDTGVIMGRPPAAGRFPGDPTAQQPRRPLSPVPGVEQQSGVKKTPPKTPEEVVNGGTLVEGETRYPRSGYLYFAYKGKLKSMKSVELLYEGPEGEATLKLK